MIASSARNKKTLLAMPRDEPKPSRKNTKIGCVLYTYTYKKSKIYDEKFDVKIRKRQPKWFVWTSPAERKKSILSLAKGSSRPKSVYSYTHKGGWSYDADFDKEIRKNQPEWFESISDKNKKELLSLDEGCERPRYDTKLGAILFHYISKNYTNSEQNYDATFTRKIKKKQPQWFVKSICKNKADIMSIKKGDKKPSSRSCLGRALYHYTNTNRSNVMHDVEFSKKIRKKHPRWFKK